MRSFTGAASGNISDGNNWYSEIVRHEQTFVVKFIAQPNYRPVD
jgi:hypothetical protein